MSNEAAPPCSLSLLARLLLLPPLLLLLLCRLCSCGTGLATPRPRSIAMRLSSHRACATWSAEVSRLTQQQFV